LAAGGGGVMWPPRATEGKERQIGRKNEYFKRKKFDILRPKFLNY